MIILSKVLMVLLTFLYMFIICESIWQIFKSYRSRIMGLCPLTGTKAKSEPMSPLTGTELVNGVDVVNKTQHVNVTQASTKKEGGE